MNNEQFVKPKNSIFQQKLFNHFGFAKPISIISRFFVFMLFVEVGKEKNAMKFVGEIRSWIIQRKYAGTFEQKMDRLVEISNQCQLVLSFKIVVS